MRVWVVPVWGGVVEYEFDEFRPEVAVAHARRRHHFDHPGWGGAIFRVLVLPPNDDRAAPPKSNWKPTKHPTVTEQLAKLVAG